MVHNPCTVVLLCPPPRAATGRVPCKAFRGNRLRRARLLPSVSPRRRLAPSIRSPLHRHRHRHNGVPAQCAAGSRHCPALPRPADEAATAGPHDGLRGRCGAGAGAGRVGAGQLARVPRAADPGVPRPGRAGGQRARAGGFPAAGVRGRGAEAGGAARGRGHGTGVPPAGRRLRRELQGFRRQQHPRHVPAHAADGRRPHLRRPDAHHQGCSYSFMVHQSPVTTSRPLSPPLIQSKHRFFFLNDRSSVWKNPRLNA